VKSGIPFRPLSFVMDGNDRIALIGLSHVDFLTPRDKMECIMAAGSAYGVFGMSLSDLSGIVRRRMRTRLWKPDAILAAGEKTWKLLTPGVLGCIFYWDSTYPPQLRETSDPPVTLFYRGTLPENGYLLAGIVGTRFPTGGARAAAFRLGFELGRHGIGVVSGLARGIDREAHEGCVEAAGYSVAVLGNGIDDVYPASSRKAARSVLDTGGAIVSEYPPGTPPLQHHFPARNRIISGLCRGVVIVQAPLRSGALITARYALEQDRDVFVHAGGLAGSVGEGTRWLAEYGAPVISGAKELLNDWGRDFREPSSAAALPGESETDARARAFEAEMEGACATKAGETYWRR